MKSSSFIYFQVDDSTDLQRKMSVQVKNPHLERLKVDYLYHLRIDSESTNLQEKFGDTKFVIMGGSEGRMSKFATALYNDLKGIFAFFAVVLSKKDYHLNANYMNAFIQCK